MADLACLQAIVHGHVQGVFFRDFVARRARKLGLTGYARNLSDGTMEVLAEGERKSLEELARHIETGPPAAKVTGVVTRWSEPAEKYTGFSITY